MRTRHASRGACIRINLKISSNIQDASIEVNNSSCGNGDAGGFVTTSQGFDCLLDLHA